MFSLFQHLRDSKLDHREEEALYNRYKQSIDLSPKIPVDAPFKEFLQHRKQPLLPNLVKGGLDLLYKNTDCRGQMLAQAAISAHCKHLAKQLTAIDTFLKKPQCPYEAEDLYGLIETKFSELEKAIVEQHAAEISRIKHQFENEVCFRSEASKATGSHNPAKIDQFLNQCLQQVQMIHAEELKRLEEKQALCLKSLNEKFAQEKVTVTHLAALHARNLQERRAIDELHEKRKESAKAAGTPEIILQGNSAYFHKLNGKDLPAQTYSGRELSFNPKTGTYSVAFPHQWLNPFYYKINKAGLQNDLYAMARLVREQGHPSAHFDMRHENEAHAKELGREAYIACLRAGFPEDKIKAKVNGKKVEISALFADNPGRLQEGKLEAELMTKRLSINSSKVSQHAKARLMQTIEAQAAAAPSAAIASP